MSRLLDLTAVQLGRKIKEREVGVEEGVKACLDQIEKLEPALHAFVTIDKEGALRQAAMVQKQIDQGT